MITFSLGRLCTEFFTRNPRFENFHTLYAVGILNSFASVRPLGGKVILQWADTPNVLLAMKYLRETESVNGPSGATGHLIHGIRSLTTSKWTPALRSRDNREHQYPWGQAARACSERSVVCPLKRPGFQLWNFALSVSSSTRVRV